MSTFPLALALAYSGLMTLSLGMERHHQQVMRSGALPRGRRLLLRSAGWCALVGSLLLCLASDSAYAVIIWCGLLTAAALVLVLLLPVAPRAAAWLGPVLLSTGLCATILGE